MNKKKLTVYSFFKLYQFDTANLDHTEYDGTIKII